VVGPARNLAISLSSISLVATLCTCRGLRTVTVDSLSVGSVEWATGTSTLSRCDDDGADIIGAGGGANGFDRNNQRKFSERLLMVVVDICWTHLGRGSRKKTRGNTMCGMWVEMMALGSGVRARSHVVASGT
jgi:hypothetical protein